MATRVLLRQVQLLDHPQRPPRCCDVLVEDGVIRCLGDGAAGQDCLEMAAGHLWLAPALVDPHSVLEDPLHGTAETLASLAAAAAQGGYGTVALLPWARSWRDRPERLQLQWPVPLQLLLWGSFSLDGEDRDLAPHGDQLTSGAIGLACGDALPPLALLERGLRLAEMDDRPVLVPPRDASLSQQGFVRERVEALRAGWPPDPAVSESVPLQSLLALAAALPQAPVRLMNLSTSEAVAQLRGAPFPPPASVCWWHLLADSGSLDPLAEGWRVVPSLGGPQDREDLLTALEEGLIAAVAVHHLPLDPEEQLLPLDQRRAGLAGHGLVLPLLWQALVGGRGWSPQLLWQRLCWGPARLLGIPEPTLEPGCRRWILFDPDHSWQWDGASRRSLAANQPYSSLLVRGGVVASGLTDPKEWALRSAPSH
ncbi:MAG: dihydroorotase [Cyanobacteriota bacterium]|jgi:dihydroorotase